MPGLAAGRGRGPSGSNRLRVRRARRLGMDQGPERGPRSATRWIRLLRLPGPRQARARRDGRSLPGPGSGRERRGSDSARGMSGCIARTMRRCGRRGRRWAASGDHRGSIRASFGTETGEGNSTRHGARGTPRGPSSARPPAKSSTHERECRNDQRETLRAWRSVSPSLRGGSGRAGRTASGMPGTRPALSSACPIRPNAGADRSGRLALNAWFGTTYRGGDRSRSGPCDRSGFRPRWADRARPKPPGSVREEEARPPGSKRRAGGGSLGVARWLRRDHSGPDRGQSSGGIVLVPLGVTVRSNLPRRAW
jgi:hypothetical protein